MSVDAPLSYMTGGGQPQCARFADARLGFLCHLRHRRRRHHRAYRASRSAVREPGPRRPTCRDVGRDGGGLALIWWGVGLSVPVLVAMALVEFPHHAPAGRSAPDAGASRSR